MQQPTISPLAVVGAVVGGLAALAFAPMAFYPLWVDTTYDGDWNLFTAVTHGTLGTIATVSGIVIIVVGALHLIASVLGLFARPARGFAVVTGCLALLLGVGVLIVGFMQSREGVEPGLMLYLGTVASALCLVGAIMLAASGRGIAPAAEHRGAAPVFPGQQQYGQPYHGHPQGSAQPDRYAQYGQPQGSTRPEQQQYGQPHGSTRQEQQQYGQPQYGQPHGSTEYPGRPGPHTGPHDQQQ